MTEREQFEAAMSAYCDPARVKETFYREGDNYEAYATLFAWEAWQAARATPADQDDSEMGHQWRVCFGHITPEEVLAAFNKRATPADPKPEAFQIMMVEAGFKSGDEGAIRLALQLAGAQPCDTCGYVHYKCRCATPAYQEPVQWMVTNLFIVSVSFHAEEKEARKFTGRHYKVEPCYATPADQVCATCNGNGLIGGPSFYAPDGGGEPCPDCATPADHSVPVAVYQSRAKDHLCYGTAWQDVDQDEYEAVGRTTNYERRIVYAQPPQIAADHIVDANKKVDAPIAWMRTYRQFSDHPIDPDPGYLVTSFHQNADYAAKYPAENLPLYAAPQPEAQSVRDAWISVDERLPEGGELVLVCVRNGVQSSDEDAEEYECEAVQVVDFGQFNEPGGYMECFAGPHGAFADDITHWQPLPAPPKKPVSDEVKP